MFIDSFNEKKRRSKVIERESAAARQFEVRYAEEITAKEFLFSTGILGFPLCRRYRLERFRPLDGGASPFLLMCGVDQELTLPLIHPDSAGLDYHVPVDPETLAALDAKSPSALMPLLIVTVRDRLADITVNLQGPLVLNPHSLRGTQLVVEGYPLRHPLLIPG